MRKTWDTQALLTRESYHGVEETPFQEVWFEG
jgi:hypothetical protein